MRVAVGVLILQFVAVAPASADDPPDLVAYLAEIRNLAVSEMARNHLSAVSGYRLGHNTLEFREDDQSGRYWPRFSSTTCPWPNADPSEVAKWQEELASATEADVHLLRPLADADASGFVTTEEAWAFRSRVEFGYLAAAVGGGGTVSADALATAAGVGQAQAQLQLQEYLALLERIQSLGLSGFPDLAASE